MTTPRKVNAYARPCNKRLGGLGTLLAGGLAVEHGRPCDRLNATAALQHAEAFLFHAKRGAWQQARAALANVRYYAGRCGTTAVGDEFQEQQP